ncbi:MAG: TVP38/TMEM64 family protein [Clostridia bacterium]|nr:TVP38/TMEM64 family protein [Clostridia bacterium]
MEELTKKKKAIRITLVIAVFAIFICVIYFLLRFTGLWESINSVNKIRDLIISFGFYGRLGFVIIQFLQVTFLPIPSTITTLAGVLIYGPLQAGFLSLSGILLGSTFAFWLGKKFGRKLVAYMVGEKSCEKWVKYLSNAKYTFFIMMLLPIFPDDVLCLVAGLTNMSWAFFIFTNLISRPIGIFTTAYLGSGMIIPYHGWGLIVWGFILLVAGVSIYLSIKYKEKIENFINKIFSKKDKKSSKNKEKI